MPPFLKFYAGLTPADFRALTLADYRALEEYRQAVLKAQEAPHGSQ